MILYIKKAGKVVFKWSNMQLMGCCGEKDHSLVLLFQKNGYRK